MAWRGCPGGAVAGNDRTWPAPQRLGGYTTLFEMKRSKELLLRWAISAPSRR